MVKKDIAEKSKVVARSDGRKFSGKKQRMRSALFDASRVYSVSDALSAFATDENKAGFDETFEFVVNLGIDPKKPDQALRDLFSLPKSLGKSVKVAVFTKTKSVEAQKAGADFVGSDDLVEKVLGGGLDFNVFYIATPETMSQVGKLGKILGPKGLMPNPKLGTVTEDVATAVAKAKAGQVQIRNDKNGIVSIVVGKMSFSRDDLLSNIRACFSRLLELKPESTKGIYIKRAYLTCTMGPSCRIDVNSITQ